MANEEQAMSEDRQKFIDYIVADKTVIPDEETKCYTEKIIYLSNY